MSKLNELYKQKEELTQTQTVLEAWMYYFDDIELYALAEQIEDDLDSVIQLQYVLQTQINKLEGVK